MVSLIRRTRGNQSKPLGTDFADPADPVGTFPPIPIPVSDPLYAFLLASSGPVDLGGLPLASPTVETLRGHGVDIVVPLVGNGELMGVLYLGPRRSDRPYSSDDRKLLTALADKVAPTIRVAQLLRQQADESKERERIEQELRIAALIQQTLLPKELPAITGWTVDAFYRPAREIGGDFYDFIPLGGSRLGVVIGDVTDKGVPAALVMATCRAMLRAAAAQHDEAGAVLAAVNNALQPEIPPNMFVTCLYAILDTDSGELQYANAGHNLPYVQTSNGVTELRATGMPLGLMPDMEYEQRQYHLALGEVMVLTSDGITEAHNGEGEMYGFDRLIAQVGASGPARTAVSDLIDDLEGFVGPDAVQEDDITLVVVHRSSSARVSAEAFEELEKVGPKSVAKFSVASVEGNERTAIDQVADAIIHVHLTQAKLEKLQTAVGETVMNAIEHGNKSQEDLDVTVEVLVDASRITVRVTDSGGEGEFQPAPEPNLEDKLDGLQSPRGWGLFLIEAMVDEVQAFDDGPVHTVEPIVNIGEDH
jgi:serine phosphatase RsbU (regulator of sigma subunit)/anti-sigma regulatory factor (Ser/Thr protein kinase)